MKRLGIVLLVWAICRVLFFILNHHLFETVTLPDYFKMLVYGLRFDLSGITYVNALFILLVLLPIPALYSRWGQRIIFTVFAFCNIIALFFNCVDVIYYRFILRRSTSDIFIKFTLGNDFINILPSIIADYWYMILAWMVLSAFVVWSYRRLSPFPGFTGKQLLHSLYNLPALIIIVGLSVVMMRGGIQVKPIGVITASQMVGPEKAALVLNTPFTIISTWDKQYLPQKTYFPERELSRYYSPIHLYPKPAGSFKRMNVVVIIMESFGKEFMGPPFGDQGLTPFLDALIQRGLFFDQAFANGTNSIEAVPAITASIPTLMPDPYITSAYASNRINSLASLLGAEGYNTYFFHGGRTGTMGFDAFCRTAGYRHYLGSDDYPNGKDYDGDWGIFDEPFFQFFAGKLNGSPQPFFAVFFSLTSHHPYTVPKEYESRFPAGKEPLYRTIQYSDYALERFFATAKTMPWYRNTLFVITADHTAQPASAFYKTRVGSYSIPLLYFSPADKNLKGISNRITQQIDIMPTILDYLNYGKPFFSFGQSAFGKEDEGFAVNYRDGVYQYLRGGYALEFDEENALGLRRYMPGRVEQSDVRSDPQHAPLLKGMLQHCEGLIQTYNRALEKNRMTVD